MQAKNVKWKKVFRWLPGVLISLIAIYAVLKFVNFDDLKSAFQTVKPFFFLILIVIDILGILIRGKAWQVILGDGVTYKQAFFGVSEGYFLNNMLPFRAGEIGRSYFVGRNTGKGTFFVLSTIVIERAFDIAFAALFVMLTLPYIKGMDWIKPIATIALILVVAALFTLFLIARNKESVLNWADKLKKPEKLIKFVLPKVRNIIDGFSLLAKPSRFLLCLMWFGICWTVWLMAYFLAVNAILPGSPLWWGIFTCGVLALGVAIPSAPSGIGVYEASFVAAIVILGGQSGTALAYALILHLVQFAIIAIFGIWGLIREGLSFSQMFRSFDSPTVDLGSAAKENEGE